MYKVFRSIRYWFRRNANVMQGIALCGAVIFGAVALFGFMGLLDSADPYENYSVDCRVLAPSFVAPVGTLVPAGVAAQDAQQTCTFSEKDEQIFLKTYLESEKASNHEDALCFLTILLGSLGIMFGFWATYSYLEDFKKRFKLICTNLNCDKTHYICSDSAKFCPQCTCKTELIEMMCKHGHTIVDSYEKCCATCSFPNNKTGVDKNNINTYQLEKAKKK
jgi:hypothetical protein